MELAPTGLRQFFAKLDLVLDERQRRLVAGALAEAFGRGGTTWVTEASGMSRNTVIDGRREIEAGPAQPGRVRAPGAGRRLLEDEQSGLVEALDALVLSPQTRGDPMSALIWTAKSTETLARELVAQGFRSRPTRWAGCSSGWATASRLRQRPRRGPRTQTVMASSPG